jgi:hypothetical protein
LWWVNVSEDQERDERVLFTGSLVIFYQLMRLRDDRRIVYRELERGYHDLFKTPGGNV